MVLPVVGEKPQGTVLVSTENSLYGAVCDFTSKQFNRRFSTRLEQFYPLILSFWVEGEVNAVVGFRPAAEEPLFLEQYLEQPVEALLGANRESIVEIGGFAAINRAAALPLMREAAVQLNELGFSLAVCTANAPIRRCLTNLGIEFRVIGDVDPGLVADSAESWGSYYKSAPEVVAGDIGEGVQVMRRVFGAIA